MKKSGEVVAEAAALIAASHALHVLGSLTGDDAVRPKALYVGHQIGCIVHDLRATGNAGSIPVSPEKCLTTHSIVLGMSAPVQFDDPPPDGQAIQAELDRLDRREAEIQSALDDVDHDMRRCNDDLERAGWRSGHLEARRRLLMESRQAIVADLERLASRRLAIGERLIRLREVRQGEQENG